MLNEKKEYEYYLKKDYFNLLRPKNLKNEFSGAKRCFTVLARGMYEKLSDFPYEKRYEYCIEFLRLWMLGGLEESALAAELKDFESIYPDFEKASRHCLKRYYIENGLDINDLETRSRSHLSPMFTFEKTNGKVSADTKKREGNTQNKGNFKAIFAEAIHAGNLTSKKLVYKNSDLKLFIRNIYDKSVTNNQIEKILGITGVYLQNKFDDQQYVPICKSEISNYLGCDASSKDAKGLRTVADFINKCPFVYKNNREKIFVARTNEKGQLHKLCVNKEWLSDLDIHLIDKKDKTPDGYKEFNEIAFLSHRRIMKPKS